MADVIVERSAHVGGRGTGPLTENPWQLRWGAIFGGTFVALGLWALLYVFGLAVGLVVADGESGRFNFPGAFVGIWAAIAPLVALFVGGLIAARTAGPQDKVSGAIHGAVLWGLSTVLGAVAMWMMISALIAGAAGLGQRLAGAAGQADMQAIEQVLGVQAEQLLQPVNQRLQAEGHPPITAEQLQGTLKDVANRALREGGLNREIVEQALVANTQMQQQDVQQIAGDIEQQLQQTVQQLQSTAVSAAEQTGRAMWGLFFALLLGLISAVIGAVLGTSRRQQMLTAEPDMRDVP